MDRIMKVRLYNKESNRMIYPSKIEANSFENYYMDLKNGEIKYYQACYDGGFFDEDVIVMEFTGVYDKNGKEIYTSDIVKITEKENISKHKVIPMKPIIAAIQWSEEYLTYILITLSVKDAFESLADYLEEYDIEVIGNIYNNKDLLEEEKNDRRMD